jgi:hypothetical protein
MIRANWHTGGNCTCHVLMKVDVDEINSLRCFCEREVDAGITNGGPVNATLPMRNVDALLVLDS